VSDTRELADRFHNRWLEVHPLAATSYGIPGFDHLVPDDSEEGDRAWRSEVNGFIEQTEAVDKDGLALEDRVTLACLKEVAAQEVAMVDSAAIEHTVTAMPYSQPGQFLAVAARTVLVDAQSADSYLDRLNRSGPWMDQVSARLREGARKGRVPVAPLVVRAIAWGEGVISAPEPRPVMTPAPPHGWDGAAVWEERRRQAAADVVRPAIGRWVETLRELLPVSRSAEDAGMAHLPGGEEDYARAVRMHTTLTTTPAELHQIGRDAIDSLEERARELGRDIGLPSLEDVRRALCDSAGDRSPEDAMSEAIAAIRRAEARAPEFFPSPLPAPCAVTPMPQFVASSGAAPHYTPPRLDGGRPGTFWFNTDRPTAGTGWDLEVVAFHEAVPGHHLQLSRLQLLDQLPALQRQRSLTAFSEGWGLYSEQLAEEVGLYTDTRSLLGSISASLMRAARLVVDTGLHAFGWTRTQAVDYLVTHVPMPADFMASEADRYIVMPGQALAYMTGKLEILKLRDEAQRRLRNRFSLPEFHATVLDHGSLPLPALAQSVTGWIDQAL
jgi:uncharacterized protein (DUF885 family)